MAGSCSLPIIVQALAVSHIEGDKEPSYKKGVNHAFREHLPVGKRALVRSLATGDGLPDPSFDRLHRAGIHELKKKLDGSFAAPEEVKSAASVVYLARPIIKGSMDANGTRGPASGTMERLASAMLPWASSESVSAVLRMSKTGRAKLPEMKGGLVGEGNWTRATRGCVAPDPTSLSLRKKSAGILQNILTAAALGGVGDLVEVNMFVLAVFEVKYPAMQQLVESSWITTNGGFSDQLALFVATEAVTLLNMQAGRNGGFTQKTLGEKRWQAL